MVKNLSKQYETPKVAWNQERIDREEELSEEYGLKNKEEIYKAYSELRGLRRQARKLIGQDNPEQEEDILNKANRLGLVKSDAGLEDLLTLNVEDILDRRLQTAVERRGLADSISHARQLVTHGRVKVDGKVVNIPSYKLTKTEEKTIEVEEPSESSDTEPDTSEESGTDGEDQESEEENEDENSEESEDTSDENQDSEDSEEEKEE
jgi:small subunit ribosomal protein S4